MTAAAMVAGVPCADCRGGGEVNGVPCRACKGNGRTGAKRPRRRLLATRPALAAASAAGTLVRWSRSVPGVAGAGCVTLGAAMIVHAAWPWIPESAPLLAVGGVFGLLADRDL
jgi:hypothetical protein